MSLEKWAENAWLRREAPSAAEITGLLTIVDRSLADAEVDAISTDLRFASAFNAVLQAATVALRASGYRAPAQAGQHVRTIESLEFTIGADDKLVQKLKVFNNKRNKTTYDTAGGITPQDLASLLTTARGIRGAVKDWVQKNHPALMAK